MGIQIEALKNGLKYLGKVPNNTTMFRSTSYVSKPLFSQKTDVFAKTVEGVVNKGEKNLVKTFNKEEILTEYCTKNNFTVEEVAKRFDEVAPHLDNVSQERLLKLVQENKVQLYSNAKEKFIFIMNRNASDGMQIATPKGILNYFTGSPKELVETAQSLKLLLALEKEGKLAAENISELLKMHPKGYGKECSEFIKMLRNGEVRNENVSQALLMVENRIPLDIFNPKNLAKYSKEDLGNFSKVLQASRKKIPQDMLQNIAKELQTLVRVNKVPKNISENFIKNFESNMKVFANSKHTIDDLVQAGGIQLQYSRSALKENILSKISHLSEKEQNGILNKFGLTKSSENVLGGLPVIAENSAQLSNVEKIVNNEIKKFLTENKIVLPKGFEEYQGAIDDICKTFPEFMFAIGSKQHKTHSKYLAEHMLMAMQENMRNPLYKTLSTTDKKVLGISTLLHDINKTEHIVDSVHPLTSSQTVNSIVQKMEGLTTTEKNRIINFVENHHWLTKINQGTEFDSEIVKDLSFKFSHSNDFTMAKIFAESDLKAVNSHFFNSYGSKINTPMTKAIEDKIFELQSKGRMVFTKDITLQKAIDEGVAKTIVTGEGENAVTNWVANAKQLGLDKDNIIYHAAKDEGLMSVVGNCGYKKGLVLSTSLGRVGKNATFQNYPEFVGFRQVDMSNIGSAFVRNTKYGKDYEKFKMLAKKDGCFVAKVKAQCPVSDEQYVRAFKEISGRDIKLTDVHADKEIQCIMGGEAEAAALENALKNVNKELESTATEYGEAVIFEPEAAFIGTKRGIGEMSTELKKFCSENNILIVENF